uniref:DUF659 domain-containing protein n=1 Tax=Cajanus cajan TaxID=3821 RepID=A0A151TPX2_CAJCA|nr:hypothetical protein KK1_022740 [Cajanus cajan]
MQEWISNLETTWKEKWVTIMCDGWTNSINHTHIMNFLVYCSNGTIFLKSIDVSSVDTRNTDYYFQLLDKVVEEVGEEFVIQVVTDNEKALKASGQKLMENRHLYWIACVAHCLDLCLEDIEGKKNVQNLLSDVKVVKTFTYNHTRIANFMKLQHEIENKVSNEKSQEEIEGSFNPINLDYIFREDDPLSPWIKERENPFLDGVQNSKWLPRIDIDDEGVEGGDSDNDGGDLSPPSNNSGDDGIDIEGEENDGEDEQRQNDPY